MKIRFDRLLAVLLVVLLAVLVAQPYVERLVFEEDEPRLVAPRADLAAAEKTAVEIFNAVSPSVVQVVGAPPRGALRRGPAGRGRAAQSGSGFVWDRAGHIVTNAHVVEGAASLGVRLASGDLVPAEVVGSARDYDLAVLRVTRTQDLPPPVAVGSSDELQVGQSAFAIGNPFGLDQSLTTGVISALERRLPTSEGREIPGVIQTDAAINPGNSGGPLLDSAGRLIGVNSAILSPSGVSAGIGFAIPVSVVNRVVPDLIRDGRVPTPGIGILAADEALVAQLGLPGVVVADVVPGSPADQAGLSGIDWQRGIVGDVIVEVEGERVRHLPDLTSKLQQLGVGETATLTVLRGRRRMTVEVEIEDIG